MTTDKKYDKLYKANNALINKHHILKKKYIRVKNENLRHMQDKVYLQDEILKRDIERYNKPTKNAVYEL